MANRHQHWMTDFGTNERHHLSGWPQSKWWPMLSYGGSAAQWWLTNESSIENLSSRLLQITFPLALASGRALIKTLFDPVSSANRTFLLAYYTHFQFHQRSHKFLYRKIVTNRNEIALSLRVEWWVISSADIVFQNIHFICSAHSHASGILFRSALHFSGRLLSCYC